MATTKKKQEHKTAEEVKMELNEQQEQLNDKQCAVEVEEVLKKHGRALQPYLARSEFGDAPRVRLVRMPAQPEVAETEDGKEGE